MPTLEMMGTREVVMFDMLGDEVGVVLTKWERDLVVGWIWRRL